jgi:hypothetical protein
MSAPGSQHRWATDLPVAVGVGRSGEPGSRKDRRGVVRVDGVEPASGTQGWALLDRFQQLGWLSHSRRSRAVHATNQGVEGLRTELSANLS